MPKGKQHPQDAQALAAPPIATPPGCPSTFSSPVILFFSPSLPPALPPSLRIYFPSTYNAFPILWQVKSFFSFGSQLEQTLTRKSLLNHLLGQVLALFIYGFPCPSLEVSTKLFFYICPETLSSREVGTVSGLIVFCTESTMPIPRPGTEQVLHKYFWININQCFYSFLADFHDMNWIIQEWVICSWVISLADSLTPSSSFNQPDFTNVPKYFHLFWHRQLVLQIRTRGTTYSTYILVILETFF